MASQPPPLPLDYRREGDPPPKEPYWGKFALGVLAGLVFSGTYYFAAAARGANLGALPLMGAVIIKLGAGAALCTSPKWRPFGIGLIASVAVALLIFVAACFGIFAIAVSNSK